MSALIIRLPEEKRTRLTRSAGQSGFQSYAEGTPGRAPLRHLLGGRQARGMLLKTLAAEKLGAEDLVVGPGRDRGSVNWHRCRPVCG
jgi:hypothetical protein